jgi:hypothetical protein
MGWPEAVVTAVTVNSLIWGVVVVIWIFNRR